MHVSGDKTKLYIKLPASKYALECPNGTERVSGHWTPMYRYFYCLSTSVHVHIPYCVYLDMVSSSHSLGNFEREMVFVCFLSAQ